MSPPPFWKLFGAASPFLIVVAACGRCLLPASAFPSQISLCRSLVKQLELFVVAEDRLLTAVNLSVCTKEPADVAQDGSLSARNRATAFGYLSFSRTLPKRWLPAFDTESTAFSATLLATVFVDLSGADGCRNGGAVDAG